MFEINDPEITLVSKIGKENRNALIIDNFYKNPDEVREYALSSKRYSPQENPDLLSAFPGWRVFEYDKRIQNLKPFFTGISREPLWRRPINYHYWDANWREQGFMVNILNQSSYDHSIFPHQDCFDNHFGVVIYLNTPEECQGGTNLYSWHGSQTTPEPDMIDDPIDSGNWKVVLGLEMVYNRCVVYESETLHMQWMNERMFTDHDRIAQVLFM